jgi:hypothetical protein
MGNDIPPEKGARSRPTGQQPADVTTRLAYLTDVIARPTSQ